jgi:hypothetical protein
MTEHVEDGLDRLFSRRNVRLANLKFFSGSSDLISSEEFRKEFFAAEDRKQSGAVKSSNPPSCKKPPIDLRKLVADM